MSFRPEQYFYFYNQYPASYMNSYPLIKQDQNLNQTKYIESLQSQNKLLREKVAILQDKILQLQQNQPQKEQSSQKKQIRQEKKSSSQFKCQYDDCNRVYKSSLALNLHMKMKHNSGSIRERQAYAKLICQCQKSGKPVPQININFPPNFLQRYKQRVQKGKTSSKEQQQ